MMQGKLPDHVQMLLSPPEYPHPVERVQPLQTHISHVLLAGDYVHKIEKPVDMGFLDYTTLEKRRFHCEEEVRLNSRLCSDAYLGVVAISTVDGKVLLDAPGGTVLDYAVKMRRLPEQRMMERLPKESAVSSEMLIRLTGQLAAFHQSSESSKHISTFGSRETVGGNWQENFDQTD
jgi:aminoglycoside phosphotransferase family enzyme